MRIHLLYLTILICLISCNQDPANTSTEEVKSGIDVLITEPDKTTQKEEKQKFTPKANSTLSKRKVDPELLAGDKKDPKSLHKKLTREDLKDLVEKNKDPEAVREAPDLSFFHGKYEADKMDVLIKTVKGIKDSSMVVSAQPGYWEKVLGIKPIKYWFRENGTYQTTYYDPSGRINRVFSGKWKLEDGIVTLDELTPKPVQYVYDYTTKFESEIHIRLRGVLDYDYDGEKDDKMILVLRKISNR